MLSLSYLSDHSRWVAQCWGRPHRSYQGTNLGCMLLICTWSTVLHTTSAHRDAAPAQLNNNPTQTLTYATLISPLATHSPLYHTPSLRAALWNASGARGASCDTSRLVMTWSYTATPFKIIHKLYKRLCAGCSLNRQFRGPSHLLVSTCCDRSWCPCQLVATFSCNSDLKATSKLTRHCA